MLSATPPDKSDDAITNEEISVLQKVVPGDLDTVLKKTGINMKDENEVKKEISRIKKFMKWTRENDLIWDKDDVDIPIDAESLMNDPFFQAIKRIDLVLLRMEA